VSGHDFTGCGTTQPSRTVPVLCAPNRRGSESPCRNVRTKRTKRTNSPDENPPVGGGRLSPGQPGDKRDDLCAYALRIGASRLSSSVRVIWPGMASGPCPVVFSKLSRLLNQENALSAPCLCCDFCSPQGAPEGRKNSADRREPSLLISHYGLLHLSHHADGH
jgi:hypothetical protein